jgi:hypothetical protein
VQSRSRAPRPIRYLSADRCVSLPAHPSKPESRLGCFNRSVSVARGSCAEGRDDLCRAVRVRIEALDRDAVVGEGERDGLACLHPEPFAIARRRDVDRVRIGMGGTPAALALDDPAPERDRADDPLDARRVSPATFLEVRSSLFGLPGRIDAAATTA